jgi:lipid-A-disaccharide synthase
MKFKQKNIFLFAGEQSGEHLGAQLMHELKQTISHVFWGVGGEKMIQEGLEPFLRVEAFSVMGFSDVLLAVPKLYFYLRKITNEILKNAPEAVILIDYAEFNMLLSNRLRKKGYRGKIIQYVSPSVWAWRKNRVYSLAKTLDHLISIFPFEKEHFSKTTLPVTYVGNPLVHKIANHSYHPLQLSQKKIIALFPGSRRTEIAQNLDLQIDAALELVKEDPSYGLAISIANKKVEKMVQESVKKRGVNVDLVDSKHTYELMQQCVGAIAKCGTVTLELAMHHKRAVVTYKMGLINYICGRYLFRILLPHYALPNIILKRTIFPEFLHRKISSQKVATALKAILENNSSQDFHELNTILQASDPSREAAFIISSILEGKAKKPQSMPLAAAQ